MDKDITVYELIDKTLQSNYRKSAGAMLLHIKYLSRNPSSDMVASLNQLDQEVQGLTESGEPLILSNKKLKNALSAYSALLVITAGLISKNAPAIQSSGQSVAPQSVTARVFIDLTNKLIKGGINPMSAQALKRYQSAIREAGNGFVIPSLKSLSTQKALDYLNTGAWKEKMMRWGSGYYERTYNIFENGMANGWGPKYTAARLREVANNIPYSAAESLTRTLQLNAYRQASLETEAVNGAFITKKLWIATMDDRTCLVPDTLIETVDGSKKIQDIKIGELVKTHKGTYQKVTDIMSKDYSRQTVNIKIKDGHLECTDDHPVLILRERYCHWILAKDIQSGDSVFISSENGSYNLDHISGDTSVKWSVGNPNDVVSIGVQSDNLSSVGVGTFGVPINAVNFKGNIHTWNKEVNGISIYLGLLLKHYSKLLKAQSDILLWLTLAAILMVTAWATKLFAFGIFAGAKSVFLSTIQTFMHKDGTPANFGAIFSSIFSVTIKQLSAAKTIDVLSNHILALAFYGAIMITICIGLWNSEFFSTSGTGLVTSSALKFTFGRTVIKVRPLSDLAWSKFKLFATSLANKLLSVSLLPDSGALHRATHSASRTLDLGSQNSKLFSANSTNKVGKFSAHVVLSSNLSNRNYNGKVYNLEVENEHTYLANGFVVHNCLTCIAKHGTEIPLGETVDGHYNCRCTEFYVVPGGDEHPEFMQVDSTPGNRKFEKWQDGESWFAGLSPERQAQQASFLNSPAKLKAYQDGLPLNAFIGTYVDPTFGEQNIELSLLKVLGKSEAEQYYIRNQS